MTKITVFRTNDTYIGFRIFGHSGYAEAGEDIVCAGISALSINFINSVETFTKDKFSVNSDEEGGLIEFKFLDTASKESQLLIKSLILGLVEMEKENKEFIFVDYKEV